MVKQQYQRALGAFVVYDVNKRSTFDNVKNYWLNEFRESSQENAAIILVGNQIDRCQQNEELREVEMLEGKEFADQQGLLFLETSAVTNVNVVDAFQMLIEKIYEI